MSTGITPTAARSEQARRTLSRRNFLRFAQYVDPKYRTPAHIQYVGNKLQQVALFLETKGKEGVGRLMIEMPPQNGKSEMASRKFPAFVLGRKPDLRVIISSYGADLASKHSRAVRDLIVSTQYQALFGDLSSQNEPVELSADSRSVSTWDLAAPHRGGMVAAGVGGGITGLPCDLLICDDLVKNREEGESEARREYVDDWYKSSALTRLSPYAAIILFFTRWHPDDQAGRLIKRMIEVPGADQWEIIYLPAVAINDYPKTVDEQRQKMREGVYLPLADQLGRKPGEALWPEQFTTEWLLSKKANTSAYEFEALYQQMPYLREGGMFKREWFTKVTKGPDKVIARVRYWDKAATQGGGARTSGTLMSLGEDGFFYVEHVAKGQWSTFQRESEMIKIAERDYERCGPFPIWHPQDPGSAGLDSARATNAAMAIKGITAHFEPVTGDKETRAEPFSTAAEGGLVRLVEGGWIEGLLDELVAFPKGNFKDQVDSSSSAYTKLLEMKKNKRESRIL
jgi:predicted phage terminase large subunit-like protein